MSLPHRFRAGRAARASEGGGSGAAGGRLRAARLPSGLEANPGRLEEVETRLAAIDKLKRKYGADDRGDPRVSAKKCGAQIAAVEHAGERMEALRKEQKRLAAEYREARTRADRAPREAAARKLEKRVEAELAQLAMERTVFRVAMQRGGVVGGGADRVEFLVSPNVGEEPRPLEKVASGGEISRIALALKTCLAGPKTGRCARWCSTKWTRASAAARRKASAGD